MKYHGFKIIENDDEIEEIETWYNPHTQDLVSPEFYILAAIEDLLSEARALAKSNERDQARERLVAALEMWKELKRDD